jgi:translation elongation factor EF-Tu-like GTPase
MDHDEFRATMDPAHAYLVVQLRLLDEQEGGRKHGVRAGVNGYRPQLWIGLTGADQSKFFHDAPWVAMDREELAPGQQARVVIQPLTSSLVDILGRGVSVGFYEGDRQVGAGVIEEAVRPSAERPASLD